MPFRLGREEVNEARCDQRADDRDERQQQKWEVLVERDTRFVGLIQRGLEGDRTERGDRADECAQRDERPVLAEAEPIKRVCD